MVPDRLAAVVAPFIDAELQWGRDLLVPDSRRNADENVMTGLLQWGRDLLVPDRLLAPMPTPEDDDASMGPGPFGPG